MAYEIEREGNIRRERERQRQRKETSMHVYIYDYLYACMECVTSSCHSVHGDKHAWNTQDASFREEWCIIHRGMMHHSLEDQETEAEAEAEAEP